MIWQDLRLAFRTLIKRPGFAAVAISTLLPALRAGRVDPARALHAE